MTDYRVVFLVGVVVAGLVYGGLVGVQSALDGDDGADGPAVEEPTPRGTTVHLDRTGRPTVVGEVVNGLDGAITNVTVTVTFYADGRQVDEVRSDVLRPTVPAGERAPFDVHMGSEESIDDYEVSVSYDRGGDTVEGLEVVDSRVAHRAQDQVDVVGTVRNAADERLELSAVVATFYDENGSVIGARTVRPGRTLDSEATFTVRIEFRTLGDVPSYAREFDSFDLTVIAESPG